MIRSIDWDDIIAATVDRLGAFLADEIGRLGQQVVDLLLGHHLRVVVAHHDREGNLGLLEKGDDRFPSLRSGFLGDDITRQHGDIGFLERQDRLDGLGCLGAIL